MSKVRALAAIGLVALGSACTSVGPRNLNRDQIGYGNSIGNSWKNQMLGNIVRMRYLDMPVFMDVGQVVTGYTLETRVNGTLNFGPGSESLGASGTYTDRPTITYTPMTGPDYLVSLLTPVDPHALLSLMASGYDPEVLFTWAVESLNGVSNFSGHRGGERPADPAFVEAVDLLTHLMREDAVGFEVRRDPDGGATVVLVLGGPRQGPEVLARRRRVRDLLGLPVDRDEFRVVYSPVPVGEDVLAVETRSIIQMVAALGQFVEVPQDKEGSANPGIPGEDMDPRPFRVHSSPGSPDDPFAAFRYRDDWYWIPHEDRESKRVFTLILFLSTLTSPSGIGAAPILTIPTG